MRKNKLTKLIYILLFIIAVLSIIPHKRSRFDYLNQINIIRNGMNRSENELLNDQLGLVSDSTKVINILNELTTNDINSEFTNFIESLALEDTTVYSQMIRMIDIDGFGIGNSKHEGKISSISPEVMETVNKHPGGLKNVANVEYQGQVFQIQLNQPKLYTNLDYSGKYILVWVLLGFLIFIKRDSRFRFYILSLIIILCLRILLSILSFAMNSPELWIFASIFSGTFIHIIFIVSIYKRLSSYHRFLPSILILIVLATYGLKFSNVVIIVYVIVAGLGIFSEKGIRRKIYWQNVLFIVLLLFSLALVTVFSYLILTNCGIPENDIWFSTDRYNAYPNAFIIPGIGFILNSGLALLIIFQMLFIIISLVSRLLRLKSYLIEQLNLWVLKFTLIIISLLLFYGILFIDYSPQLLRTIALGLMTLIFYYIISKYLKLFPFINPVRFNVQKKLVKLLNASYDHTNHIEYSNFFLSFLKKIQPKAKISIISQEEIIGDEFPKLEYSRLETVVKLKPANKNYLNLDLELLDETEIGKQVEDFNNSDMPHLLYPIYNNQEELQAVIVFGKFPGIYWQKSLAEAIYKLIEVFQGFYHNFLVQERYLEQSKIIVKEQEEKLYNQKLAQLKTQQNEELRAEKKLITESIEYAALIQKSLVPQAQELESAFDDYFVVWQQRDIVGGDLHWASKIPNSDDILFSVIDCTGHGIPGALMSVTANSSLERITKEHQCYQPNLILNQLHQIIGATLHQAEKNTQQDGMDMSIINYNKHSKKVHFAGAKHDLIIVKGKTQELQVIKGDKYSIGGLKWEKEINFTQHELDLERGDTLYLFTDGILDQPYPNEDNKLRRLGTQRWYELLVENNQQSMPEIKSKIQELIAQMIEISPQRDDICIVGIRVE